MEAKTITTERTIKEEKTVYVAQDGTEFISEKECKNYEESALFAVRSRLDFKRIDDGIKDKKENNPALYYALATLDGLLENGNNCSEYYLWKPKSEDDIKNYLQWAKLRTRGWGDGLLDRKYYGDCSYKVTLDELKPGRPYIVEIYTDGDYITLVNNDMFIEAAKKMFDTILSSDK